MSQKFSAEEILLKIYFAKREVARTRPKNKYPGSLSKPSRLLHPEYFSACRELANANAMARRFCARKEKEYSSFPVGFGDAE